MKTCFVCNGKLPLNRQRFCSDRCSYSNKKTNAKIKSRRRYLQIDPINCSTCGKTIIPRTTRQRYCDKHCWTVEQIKRRNAKRKHFIKPLKVIRSLEYWHAVSPKSPVFGEKKVTEAEYTMANSKERMEIQSAVEEYLRNGGKITRYGDQLAKIEVEGDLRWHLDESEEKKIQDELAHSWGIEDVLGD